mmetsp:Transcript_85815/g.251266  ORF Transcript_85815/g.251266 Transcript_85815/m.251266 type:complete len:211 (+) Transcript_85815:715-1347(+)
MPHRTLAEVEVGHVPLPKIFGLLIHGLLSHVRKSGSGLQVHRGRPPHVDQALYLGLPRQRRRARGQGVQQEQQVHVHVRLHARRIKVVGVAPKRMLDLDRNVVQGPEDEHLDEAEHHPPVPLGGALRGDEGSDAPVQDEQGIASLGVRKWERHRRNLLSLVQRHHAVGELLEDARQDRRGNAQDAVGDVLGDDHLYPGEDQGHLVLAQHQ